MAGWREEGGGEGIAAGAVGRRVWSVGWGRAGGGALGGWRGEGAGGLGGGVLVGGEVHG